MAILYKFLIYLGPVLLGFLLMFLDGYDPTSESIFTYAFSPDTGTFGVMGGIIFWVWIIFNIIHILLVWIKAIIRS